MRYSERQLRPPNSGTGALSNRFDPQPVLAHETYKRHRHRAADLLGLQWRAISPVSSYRLPVFVTVTESIMRSDLSGAVTQPLRRLL